MAGVTFENVTISYDKKVIIDDLSLEIADGECFAILGPSACGKTTLIRGLCGFKSLDSGRISIGDRLVSSGDGRGVPPEKRKIGVVFQDYAVWPHYSVFENVYYPLKKRKVPKAEAKRRALDAIEQVRMEGYEERMPAQLSGGQQQRVALARALVSSSDLMVLDEPISNLDANLREEMRFEIKELQRRTGITVIYVTHDQEAALAIADRMAIMDSRGYIRQVGAPEHVYKNPTDRYVYQFLGVSNFIPLERKGDRYSLAGAEGSPLFPYEIPVAQTADRLYAACRPVDIKIGEGPVEGVVKHVVYLGNLFEYRVMLGGREIRVQQDSHEAFAEGTPEEGRACAMSLRNLRFYENDERGDAS
ncbi:MAG: ABC transporter ATP-binding protein [Synergistaceae bacterium]|nr:ABC transporter ATP-binding protein [Synergistota bacterium]NLM71152.1 ABC transporter ATP-binding protein [Synergistaceae bacterium]